MILIADAGSTKTDWALIRPAHEPVLFKSPGLNPLLTDSAALPEIFRSALRPLEPFGLPDQIYYYGAGCTPAAIPAVETALAEVSGGKSTFVASDLLGAARASCGRNPGIACILGTGSNSCAFDGTNITDAVPAMGFILGDEGSGASIGRRLLSDLFKRQLDPALADRFNRQLNISPAEAIDRVYRQPAPNRFLASMLPFIRQNIDHPQLQDLVVDEFMRFLRRNVANYPNHLHLPINFTGSVALHFRPQLLQALNSLNMHVGAIIPSPIHALIDYHSPLF